MNPLAIDLFAGLGGWTEGLLAEGFYVVGFDLERHEYGKHRYPAQLVLQDVLTIHGKQFKDAALIVASPPCQEYSYMAMPWSRAKAIAAEYRAGVRDVKKLTALFDACFRIQREAIEAAGHFIPLVVENVRGAIPWVGRSRWNYGSFHLWGDVPALMPMTRSGRMKSRIPATGDRFDERVATTPEEAHAPHYRLPDDGMKGGWLSQADGAPMRRDDGERKTKNGSWDMTRKNYQADNSWGSGAKVPGFRFDGSGGSFQTASVEGTKQGGDWFNAEQPSISRMCSSKSNARKAASAMIAKIPLPLARHIARYWAPSNTNVQIFGR